MHEDLLDLATAREGHFPLESGYHGRLWLDLEGLFADPVRLGPFVDVLAAALRPHAPEVVCGPLIGGAFLAQMLSLRLDVEFLFTERMPLTPGRGLYGVRYRVPRSLRERIRGKRVAIVDDAISAGSAVRGTYHDLSALGAQPVVVGALLLLGSAALRFFEHARVPVTWVARLPFELWTPADCPLCASGHALEEPAGVYEPRHPRAKVMEVGKPRPKAARRPPRRNADEDQAEATLIAAQAMMNREGPHEGSKLPSASLNLSTYIALYNYGSRNLYELAPLVDLEASKLSFETS